MSMLSLSKPLFYGLYAVFVISMFPLQASADRIFLEGIESGTMVDPDGEYLFYPNALSDFSGFTSSGDDPSVCFDATSRTSFPQGSSVRFNVFWNDTVEEDALNEYQVVMAFKLGVIKRAIFSRGTVKFPFPDTAPGTPQRFCAYTTITLSPDAAVSTYAWGARVIKVSDGTKLQGVLNELTITEGPKQ
jgi:hypothetical protein